LPFLTTGGLNFLEDLEADFDLDLDECELFDEAAPPSF
jgi:hypothetical protein